MKIAFLDRDGTLIWEPPETLQVDSLEKLRILPRVIEGLRALQDDDYSLVMVSNQDGRGTASFPEQDFLVPQEELERRLEREGIILEQVLVCPHLPEDACPCRKPRTGLVDALLGSRPVNRQESVMVGDRDADGEFASRLGVPFVKVRTNSSFPRFAGATRRTSETRIRAFLNLDGSGRTCISTGIGFFDHMLELLSRHALLDLELKVRGDLEVDEHHTVEDTGLLLGQALALALGDKRGIERYGFWVPMDEALAEVVLDLSGRARLIFDGRFEREFVGKLPTEMIPHFFESLAQALGCALHLTIHRGLNEHHKVEALFKGMGRALRMAFRDCPHEQGVPSTKGLL